MSEPNRHDLSESEAMAIRKGRPKRSDSGMLRLVAQLYYERGLSQQDIAELTGFSVSKVSRLHRQAREAGIVRITVEADDREVKTLGENLSDALGIEVHVTPGQASTPLRESRLSGAAAAPYVMTQFPEQGVVGLSSGSTVDALVSSLPRFDAPELVFVPLIGGWDTEHPHLDSNALARRLATLTGGRAHSLYAPAMFDSADTRTAMVSEPTIRATVRLWSEVSVALIGIGSPPDTHSNYFTVMDRAEHRMRSELIRAGVVGDVVGHLFDVRGHLIEHEWSERIITPPIGDIRKMRVVAVLAGSNKVRSLVGLGRTGLVDVIATDAPTAQGALDILRE